MIITENDLFLSYKIDEAQMCHIIFPFIINQVFQIHRWE